MTLTKTVKVDTPTHMRIKDAQSKIYSETGKEPTMQETVSEMAQFFLENNGWKKKEVPVAE